MGWLQRTLLRLLAPSFLNKYLGSVIRAGFVAASAYLAAKLDLVGVPPEVVEEIRALLSPENADKLAAVLAAVFAALGLGMSFADKAKNQPKKEDELPPAKE